MTTNQDIPVRPNADLLTNGVKTKRFHLKPLNLNAVIALERIDSPFVRRPDPTSAESVPVMPSTEDVVKALYILLHANDHDLLDTLEDREVFSACIGQLAVDISLLEMREISAAINTVMSAANQAAKEAGLPESGKDEPTGPGAS